MMWTFASLKLAISVAACFSSGVVFGAASLANSRSGISPCKPEHSFLAMVVKFLLFACVHTMDPKGLF